MWWCSTPTLFYATPPPLSLRQKISGPQWHEKHPGFGPSNRLRKSGGPVRRITINRDPFHKLRFGKCQEFCGKVKPCSVNAASWFPLLKFSPI